MAHPGFRLVEPKSLQLGERGDMDDYLYQQCSGVRCQVQQPDSTRCVGVTHEMDFLSPLLVFSCNQISVQEPVFTET